MMNQTTFSPPQSCTARLEDRTQYNDRFMECHFELDHPHEISFLAGQYVSLQVDEMGTRRSYSICSTPAVSHSFSLLVDVSPQGKGSLFLQNLPFGQSVNVLCPLGRFVLQTEHEAATVFVATGSGIAPLKSMLTYLVQEKKDTRDIMLYWGMRQVAEWFWLDEIQDLVDNNHNVHFYPVLSQSVPEWTLSTGHVTDLLEVHEFAPQTGFYLCGNRQMLADSQAVLLAKGVPIEYIHHEKFY